MAGIPPTTRADVAEAARIITEAGLVEAFGHVSARTVDGFMITATRPLGAAGENDVYEIVDGRPAEGATDVPLEVPMHAAVYAAREDVNAICRTHSPAAVEAGARGEVPPLVHGLAGLAGEVAVCGRTDLVADPEAGREIAEDLGSADCLLIRGNGSIATGLCLANAVVRARYLEERCLVGRGLAPDDGWGTDRLKPRSRWFEKETSRAWAWLRWRYGRDS
ncbi:MAG: class II aldolase/adducin family protein [Solirubrobacterales bacterium]|nr:class II aldolase/adducin family protein [Solirubrobacterales bacterium]